MTHSPSLHQSSNRLRVPPFASESPTRGTETMLRFGAPGRRDYRLIDSLRQPHPQLDGLYESVEEAMDDAIRWLEGIGPSGMDTAIGLEVSTPGGCWRTIRQPDQLLCPLRIHFDEA